MVILAIEDIARICHQANKAFCEAIGDFSQDDWECAPDWQRESAMNGVKLLIDNPHVPASHMHTSWMKEKIESGWKYGPVKDPEKKEHPCIVDFDKLPAEQQAKDYLFKAIVCIFQPFVDKE